MSMGNEVYGDRMRNHGHKGGLCLVKLVRYKGFIARLSKGRS